MTAGVSVVKQGADGLVSIGAAPRRRSAPLPQWRETNHLFPAVQLPEEALAA